MAQSWYYKTITDGNAHAKYPNGKKDKVKMEANDEKYFENLRSANVPEYKMFNPTLDNNNIDVEEILTENVNVPETRIPEAPSRISEKIANETFKE